jgi:hypothetical protein
MSEINEYWYVHKRSTGWPANMIYATFRRRLQVDCKRLTLFCNINALMSTSVR